MSRDGARITSVSGGSHGVSATYARILALAGAYDQAGDRMRNWAGVGARTMASGDLLESALLSPLTFAEAEAAVLAATAGPDGVLVESVAWETDALLIRVTVRSLQETDELVHTTFEVLDQLTGRLVGHTVTAAVTTTATGLLLAGATVGAPTWHVWRRLNPPLRRRLEAGAGDAARSAARGVASRAALDAGPALQDWVADHPATLQHLVNGGGGLLDGLWDGLTPLAPGGPFGVPSFTPDTESAAGLLARLYGPERPVTVEETSLAVPGDGSPPASLPALVRHLEDVDVASAAPEHHGTIEIQTVTGGADGRVRHLVYLPGTDDLTTTPWSRDGDVRDAATNLRILAGADNGYEDGVLDAMRRAGVRPGDPVLLTGHSQGGMAAVAILAGGGHGFSITHVVTVGAPTAFVDGFPPGSRVLSLEHRGDVVPLLDGEQNPDSPQQVTVSFDDGGSGVVDSHGLAHYVAGAAAVQASAHPSVVDSLRSLGGFLASGGTVESRVFRIRRQP